MMGFMANIPHFYCYVRKEFLYDLQECHGQYVSCCVFAVDSVEGHAIGFDIMTNIGAQFARLPIHALCWKECEPIALSTVELWNNFSYDVEALEYEYLRQMRCDVYFPTYWTSGTYMFTLSWKGSRYAEDPGQGGFKRAHIIQLDSGHYAAQPNNRIRWHEPSFITEPFPHRPDFKTNSRIWNAEAGWQTESSDRYFYDTKEDT